MARATDALITSRAPSARPLATFSTIPERLNFSSACAVRKPRPTPALSTVKSPLADHSPLDRAALMRRAHQIARQARPHMPSYRAAVAYGLRAAWGLVATRREFAQVRARVAPRVLTPDQIAASRAATRRCGSSYMPF